MSDRMTKPNAVSITGRMKKTNAVKRENTGKTWKNNRRAQKNDSTTIG